MMRIAKKLAALLALPTGLIPFGFRRAVLRALLLVETRIGQPADTLKRLFALADDLDRLISERATAYGDGVNPKHRLTSYHDFFVSNLEPGMRVLDIGCGIGEVARSVALRVPSVFVTGIDSDPAILGQAYVMPNPPNLTFVQGDATQALPEGPWDAIMLSNVLEHIDRRSEFLTSLVARVRPKRLIIRVPLFERHWHMPLRQELGVDFRSDPTHFIEHDLDSFEAEMKASNLQVVKRMTLWGEIWAVVEPVP